MQIQSTASFKHGRGGSGCARRHMLLLIGSVISTAAIAKDRPVVEPAERGQIVQENSIDAPVRCRAQTERACTPAAGMARDIRAAGASASGSPAVNGKALAETVSGAGTAYVPAGRYATNIGSASMPGPFDGIGQVGDAAGNWRASKFGIITQAPATLGDYSSAETAFNGDWRRGGGEEYRIYGAATLGRPSRGYRFTPEASPHYLALYNSSGWNQSISGNEGRTAAVGYRVHGYQAGQGDLINFSASCFVTGQRSGATNFLANPACSLFAGDAFAGQNGVYLNPIEINLDDRGKDVAGIGAVFNLKRSNGVGRLGTLWAGIRLQQAGPAAVDTAWSASGKYRFGLDFSGAIFGAEQAALSLAINQRIYGNAINADPNLRFPTDLGTDWIADDAVIGGWNFVVRGTSRLQVTKARVTALQPIEAPGLAGTAPISAATLGERTFVGAGASVSCSAGHICDQLSGMYRLRTGTGSISAGPVLTLTFPQARTNVPNCVVGLQTADGEPRPLLVAKTATRTSLTFHPGAALAPSVSYDLDYFCGGS